MSALPPNSRLYHILNFLFMPDVIYKFHKHQVPYFLSIFLSIYDKGVNRIWSGKSICDVHLKKKQDTTSMALWW